MSPLRHALVPALFAAAFIATLRPASAAGFDFPIPDSETVYPPTQGRLEAIESLAGSSGWNAVVVPIRSAAVRAYQQDRFVAADAWFHVYRWAALFSEPENRFISDWIDAIVANQLNYEGVAGEYHPTERPIGLNMSPALQAWVLSNEEFSEEFFSNLKPVDHVPTVFAILELIHRRAPDRFARYSSLALALAIVYDVAPPPYWPHQQVTPQALPRKLNPAFTMFDRLTQKDMMGRTYQRLARLRAEELKFVVDAAAPVPELDWSEVNVHYPLDRFEGTYEMVPYRKDRASKESLMIWSGRPYTLQAILSEGGICIDQAYFASEAGKARGVPTLLFQGRGQDARHAWFGFLDGDRKWRLDAGRYAEQRLVTGIARDPQTWLEVSDHELQFLSERFRALPSFAQSRVQEEFAADFMRLGDAAAAARAARLAVNYERRNVDAWETLIAADTALGFDAPRQEGVLREAALAFSPRYPDLVESYVGRICRSLRARGEASLANYEERGLADRLKGDRADLAVKNAAEIMARSIATQPVSQQIATYNALLAEFAQGSGTIFFDRVVVAFAEYLALNKMRPQAREAVERARAALDVQPGTQLSMDVDKLMRRLQD